MGVGVARVHGRPKYYAVTKEKSFRDRPNYSACNIAFHALSTQGTIWIAGYAVLVLLIGACAACLWLWPVATPPEKSQPDPEGDKRKGVTQIVPPYSSGLSRQRGKGRRKTPTTPTLRPA